MKQNRNMLGIVFYGQTIAVNQVVSAGDTFRICHSAEFKMPEAVTIENIASVRSQFETFLRENDFKAKKAVVGISAKNIMSALLNIPPIQDAESRYETVKIHLEHKLEVDLSEIVFDYWKNTDPECNTTLTLMALKKITEAVKSLLEDLKIIPIGLTVTSLGIDFNPASGLDCHLVDYPGSVEIFIFDNKDLQVVMNISKHSSDREKTELPGKIYRDINRHLCLLSAQSDPPNLSCWTTGHASSDLAGGIGKLFDDVKRLEIKSSEGSILCELAGRLAGSALTSHPVQINLLNGHQQEARSIISRQWLQRIMLTAGVILLLLGVYFYSWYSDRSKISHYQQQLDDMNENVKAAREVIDQVAFARQWFQQEPVHLENLRQLTMLFPQDSNIWLTSLAVDESLNQVITGRAISEDAILDVVDSLKSNSLFRDIKLLYIRKMGKDTDVMIFAINFHCRGEQ